MLARAFPIVAAVILPALLGARFAATAPQGHAAEPSSVAEVDPPAPWQPETSELQLPETTNDAPSPRAMANSHVEKSGRKIDYEQVPRRPDRPEDYAKYLFPLAGAPVVSGYDLDRPDRKQRRGAGLREVGHGGVDLLAARGTPVYAVPLDAQIGDAEVLYVGWLFGKTVVTRHTVRETRGEHDYVLLFAHLDATAAGVVRGRTLAPGEVLGYVGDTGCPHLVHLHFEARRMRDGIDPWGVLGWELKARDVSVVTDPRNVLPLRVSDRR